jgi:hypothetical protein
VIKLGEVDKIWDDVYWFFHAVSDQFTLHFYGWGHDAVTNVAKHFHGLFDNCGRNDPFYVVKILGKHSMKCQQKRDIAHPSNLVSQE